MKLGVIIGITRDGHKPVVIGEAGPLPEVKTALRAMRGSADGDRFSDLELWSNRTVVSRLKLKPGKPAAADQSAPEKKAPVKKKITKKADPPADE